MTAADIPLLERPITPKAALEAAYLDAIVRDGIFPAGAFALALPRDWATEPAGANVVPDVSSRPVVTLARFTPGTPQALGATIAAKVVVYAAVLPRVMNGSDWLRRWMMTQGLSPVAFRELPTDFGLMGDALALHSITGRLHRMLTVKDGDLVFLIDGSVDPHGRAQDPLLQEIPLMAMIRFRLLEPSRQRYAEAMVDTRLTASGAEAVFPLPVSWMVDPSGDAPPRGSALRARLLRGEAVAGTLVASMADADFDAATQERVVLEKLSAQGIRFGEPEPLLSGTRGALTFQALRRRGSTPDGVAVALCLRAKGLAREVSITVVGPDARSDLEAWAVNRRVFEIILESLDISI